MIKNRDFYLIGLGAFAMLCPWQASMGKWLETFISVLLAIAFLLIAVDLRQMERIELEEMRLLIERLRERQEGGE